MAEVGLHRVRGVAEQSGAPLCCESWDDILKA